ncbi:hypothetical protein TNCV_2422731 [Trichonephila clavipes]|nr:hypothetical protein TNCV_2422731 [Trichonephila clavipes]
MGSPHTDTIAVSAEIESGFAAKDDLVPFHCRPVFSFAAPLQTEELIGGRQGQHTYNECRDPKSPSARRLRMVREETWVPSEGTICAWKAADEAVGCTRVFLMM